MMIRLICALHFIRPMMRVFGFFCLIISTLPSETMASPNLITFQSRIVQPNGKALEATSVSFRFSITDALGTCVIYQEDFANRNMSGSKGLINLPLGGGVKVFPSGVMELSEVFNNYNFPAFNCQGGGTVNAGVTDRRRLVMQFNDGTGWQTVPAMDINANPFAMQAMSAHKLGDYPAADYVRTAALPDCTGQALTYNGIAIGCAPLGGGSGTVTNVTSANADIGVATGASTPVLTLNSGTGANQIVKLNGTSQLPAVSGVNLTNLNASSLASGTVPAAQMPALTGDVTMAAGTTATAIAAGVIVDADINAGAAIARNKLAASTVGERGDVLINDGSGNLASLQCSLNEVIKFDGAGVATCGTDNAGVGDVINGGNTVTGTMTVGTNSNHDLQLETNGTTKMTVLANGNVGVGTTSPASKLSVSGSIGASSNLVQVSGSTTDNTSTIASENISMSYSPASAAVGSQYVSAISASASTSSTDAASTVYLTGVDTQATFTAPSPTVLGRLRGGSFLANVNGSGTVSQAKGIQADSNNYNSGTVGISYGVDASVRNVGSGSITTARVLSVAGTNTGGGTILSMTGLYIEPLNGAGISSSFGVYQSSPGDNNYFAGNVGIGTTNPQRLMHVAGPMRITPTTVPAAPVVGDMYFDSADANKFKVYTDAGWIAPGAGGGGVTNVSSTNADIDVATGGSTPVLTLNTGVGANQIVKLNGSSQLPAVDGSLLTGLTSGQIPNLDAAKITSGTLAIARMPAFTGDVTAAAGNTATTIAANAVTSAKILDDEIVNVDINAAAAIARTKLASGTNNHVLINDGTGVMSSEATLAVSRGGTGLASFTNNALIMADVTGTALTNATCSPGELLLWSGVTWACTNMAASAQGFFKDGGNTFTGTATIGTNSNHNLEIETNSTTKMTVLANGNVGVGTSSPEQKLHVIGTGKFRAGSTIIDPAGTPTIGVIATAATGLAPILFDLGTSKVGLYVYGDQYGIFSEGGINYFAGNVGIGTTAPDAKLHVAGDVKIGNSAATCNVTTEGSIRYNSASKKTEFCNGSTWTESGGLSSCAAGFTLIGTIGSNSAYCISTNEETSAAWQAAATACYGKTPKAYLCDTKEWLTACVSGAAGLSNFTNANSEWVSEGAGGYPTQIGNGSCNAVTNAHVSTSSPYRCCYQ